MAISQPPPRAWPLRAAITGLGKRSILRSTPLPKRMKTSTWPPEKAEPRSAPAQKIRSPLPVMMTARTLSSCSTEASASLSSRTRASLIALAGGRLSVITTKLSSRAKSRVSNAILGHSLQENGSHRLGSFAQPIGALAQHPGGGHLIHRAEQDLGGHLHREVPTELAGGDALLEDAADQGEIGRHLVGRGAAEELVALTQLDLHHLGQVGMALQHAEVQRHQAADLGHRIGLAGDLVSDVGHPLGHLLAEQGDENLVLGLEIQVDRPAGDAGLPGDVRHAGVVVAVAGEHADRRVDNLLRLA